MVYPLNGNFDGDGLGWFGMVRDADDDEPMGGRGSAIFREIHVRLVFELSVGCSTVCIASDYGGNKLFLVRDCCNAGPPSHKIGSLTPTIAI